MEHLVHKKSVFLLMDDLSLISRIHTPQDLIQLLKFEYGYRDGEEYYVFLDEFQMIPQSGMFLKNLYDAYPNLHIIASGSSSLEITKNTEFLTGRKIVFDITPFSFREFLRVQGFTPGEHIFSLDIFSDIEAYYRIYGPTLEDMYHRYITIG